MGSEVEMNEERCDHRTMIASGSQKELRSNGSTSGKENRYTRSKNEHEDLKIALFVSNDYGLTSCKNSKVEGDSEGVIAVETRCVWIEVWRFKQIGEGRRNTIGWSGNKINRQLLYWKSKIPRGIKMTRSMESSGSKSRQKNKNEYQKGILMRCVEVEMAL